MANGRPDPAELPKARMCCCCCGLLLLLLRGRDPRRRRKRKWKWKWQVTLVSKHTDAGQHGSRHAPPGEFHPRWLSWFGSLENTHAHATPVWVIARCPGGIRHHGGRVPWVACFPGSTDRVQGSNEVLTGPSTSA